MSATAEPATKAPPDGGFQKRLGLFDSTMLIVGTMIGSGIFVVSVSIAKDVGSSGWLLLVWAVAGGMTIIGALSYAELAGMMPHAGGQYVYLREAYNPLAGFMYGWTCFLVIQTGSIAAVAVVFAKYLGVLVPALGTDATLFKVEFIDLRIYLPGLEDPIFKMRDFKVTAGHLVAVGVIVFLTGLNCFGVQEGKVVQNVFTVAKTGALILLILVGLFVVSGQGAWTLNTADVWGPMYQGDQFKKVGEKSVPSLLGSPALLVAFMVMGGAMVGALFSADAWNNITFTAGEIKNPRRNIPLSLALGTGTVICLYLLANVAYLTALPVQAHPSEVRQTLRELSQKADDLDDKADDRKLPLEERKKAAKEADDVRDEQDKVGTTFERGIEYTRQERLGTAVMSAKPDLFLSQYAAVLMAIAIMISTFGCVNGMTLMGARLYYVMARDGLFFRSVGTLNRAGVPAAGLITQGIWSILLVFSGTYDDLLDYVIFAVLIFYILTVTGLFILRFKMPTAERPYRALGYPILPAVYVFLCFVICVDLLIVKPKYTWPGLIIVATGIPVYFLWRMFTKPAQVQAS